MFILWGGYQFVNPLIDWLGSGGVPVPRELAEHRASICLDCPQHVAPKWWEKAKGSIADAIKSQLATKHSFGLELPHEDVMRMCKICGCCTALKCWTPISHIKSYTPIPEITKYPAHCWIRKELSQ